MKRSWANVLAGILAIVIGIAFSHWVRSERDHERAEQRWQQANGLDTRSLTFDEVQSIRHQIAPCWGRAIKALPIGPTLHSVVMEIRVHPDGSLESMRLVSPVSSVSTASSLTAAEQSVRKCLPLQGLPVGKYEAWKDFELNFDPKDALY